MVLVVEQILLEMLPLLSPCVRDDPVLETAVEKSRTSTTNRLAGGHKQLVSACLLQNLRNVFVMAGLLVTLTNIERFTRMIITCLLVYPPLIIFFPYLKEVSNRPSARDISGHTAAGHRSWLDELQLRLETLVPPNSNNT
ncbi:hypothetical protein RRG08_036229 [Elysia crispata]|uniref:Uncharacterized protein n=1 Tax=Elysia crispata TaxID=231223 RepID=A0AAE1CEV0_9GAST|nr:hypothetical protein RRG08_036229 [Elysia crispata]